MHVNIIKTSIILKIYEDFQLQCFTKVFTGITVNPTKAVDLSYTTAQNPWLIKTVIWFIWSWIFKNQLFEYDRSYKLVTLPGKISNLPE